MVGSATFRISPMVFRADCGRSTVMKRSVVEKNRDPLGEDGDNLLHRLHEEKAFEVLYPNQKVHLLVDDVNIAINNFILAFKLAYKHSLVKIDEMETTFRSVCSSDRDSDSGVFVMKLICHQTRGKTLCFQPNHAKPLRESLTYYMLAHPFNQKMPPETKNILTKHNIPYDYKTPCYFPWMNEHTVASQSANQSG